ncbi:right-handed parallel beta-helix repeat-containing protein [Methanobrevibacter filiformis]|uniref:Right handed beta helix domain-containing protein n=1 Tax=Methanobrevibacter filiformis TaxID=55758 RepID=A0A166DAT3_9EURY|nr:right-handed parallel beta-helix repeat-containing protein [Methanobrevibacter filiformis]KZX15390.1 hypothetical protein MBFIL_06910 [Methanobrevibacter filiformis]
MRCELLVLVIFLIFLLPNVASGAIIQVDDSSKYTNVNEQIQSILDNASSGDTIAFNGKKYENLTLSINKKLNIKTNVETSIKNSNNNNAIFSINGSKASGTTISNFSLYNEYGSTINLNNTKNINISKNKLTSSNSYGISIRDSSNINISGNTIINSIEGLIAIDSNNINIKNNNISKNNIGIDLANIKNIVISSNKIDNNKNGIILSNIVWVDVVNNEIMNNNESGIHMGSSIKDLNIKNNTIKNNYYGIRLDSTTNNGLTIKSNTITENHEGISFGFKYVDTTHKDISSNVLYKNSGKEVELIESNYATITIGSNWYGSNDWGFVNICHKLKTDLIRVDLVNMKGGLFAIRFYDENGKVVTDLPSVNLISILNGKNKQSLSTINGEAIVNYSSELDLLSNQDNNIDFYVDNFHDKKTIKKEDLYLKDNGKGNNGIGAAGDGSGSNGNGTSGIGGSGKSNNGSGDDTNVTGVFGTDKGKTDNNLDKINGGEDKTKGETLKKEGSNINSAGAKSTAAAKSKPVVAKELRIKDNTKFRIKIDYYVIAIITIFLFLFIIVGYISNYFKANRMEFKQ